MGAKNITYVVDSRTEDGDIWMTQAAIASILGVTVDTVSYHLKRKFESGELSVDENMLNPNDSKNIRIIIINPEAKTQPILYNFDAIMAVVYSVNSKQAISIRKWSNQVLKKFSTTGLVVDQKKALQNSESVEEIRYLNNLARLLGQDEFEQIRRLVKDAVDYDKNAKETKKMGDGISLFVFFYNPVRLCLTLAEFNFGNSFDCL